MAETTGDGESDLRKSLGVAAQIAAIAGVLVGVVGLIVILFSECGGDGGRSLELRMVSDVDVTRDFERVPGLAVIYNDTPVDQVRLVEISIMNDGSEPIPTEAYSEPIRFAFSDGSSMLAAEIRDPRPSQLKPMAHLLENEVHVEGLLLNEDDRFTLALVGSASADSSLLVTGGRIEGIPGELELAAIPREEDDGNDPFYLILALIGGVSGITFVASLLRWRG